MYIHLKYYQLNKIVNKMLTSNDYNLDDLNNINKNVLLEMKTKEFY